MAVAPVLVFIAHSFSPQCSSYSLADFRGTMQSIEDELNSVARHGQEISFITELSCARDLMRSALLHVLADARLGIVDISDNNPNVLFELGHLCARGVPVKILKSRASLAAGYRTPIYVDGKDIELYAGAAELKDVVKGWLAAQLRQISRQSRSGHGMASASVR